MEGFFLKKQRGKWYYNIFLSPDKKFEKRKWGYKKTKKIFIPLIKKQYKDTHLYTVL